MKNLKPVSDEMLHLDALRFIASMAIMVYHFSGQLHPSELKSLVQLLSVRMNVAVDLFFVISGFVITRFYGSIDDPGQYASFAWKRFARLYPLYLLTTLAFVAIGIAGARANVKFADPGVFDLGCLPANLLLLQSINACPRLVFNQPSWSISAEMLLYLSLPVVILLRRRPLLATLVVLCGFSLLWITGPDGSARPWYDRTYDFGALRAAPSFLLGALLYDARGWIVRSRLPGAWLMWALLAAAIPASLLLPGTAIVALLFAAAVCAIAADGRRTESSFIRRLAPLGTLTYSIYLLHPLIEIVLISFVGKKLLHLDGYVADGLVFLSVFITLGTAYLSYELLENPARRWLGGLWSPSAARLTEADRHTAI